MEPKGRQAERSEATRAALVAVGRRLFAERGFAGTSTEEIVREAGVTRGALYHHFKDKHALFQAVVEEVEAYVTQRAMEAIGSAGDLRKGLLAGSGAFLDACLEPEVQQITLTDGPAVLGPECFREISDRHGLGLITNGIELAMAEGIIEQQPAGPLAQMLMGALMEGAKSIARAEDKAATREQVGRIVERLLEGLETKS